MAWGRIDSNGSGVWGNGLGWGDNGSLGGGGERSGESVDRHTNECHWV